MGTLIFCSKNQTQNIVCRDHGCSVVVVVCFRFLETLLTSYFHQSSFLLQKALLVLDYPSTISSPITTRIRFYEFVVLCFMNCCDLVFMLGNLLELVFCVIRLPLESLKNTESTRGEIALD